MTQCEIAYSTSSPLTELQPISKGVGEAGAGEQPAGARNPEELTRNTDQSTVPGASLCLLTIEYVSAVTNHRLLYNT